MNGTEPSVRRWRPDNGFTTPRPQPGNTNIYLINCMSSPGAGAELVEMIIIWWDGFCVHISFGKWELSAHPSQLAAYLIRLILGETKKHRCSCCLLSCTRVVCSAVTLRAQKGNHNNYITRFGAVVPLTLFGCLYPFKIGAPLAI